MKNTIILLSAFLLLAATAFWFINKPDESLSTVKVEDRNFAVKDLDQIGKIFIANRQGRTTTFVRNGEGWMLNEKYKAREAAMSTLLKTIKRLELGYIPAHAAIPNIVEILGSNGIKVEIYDRENKKIRVYYVGGLSNNEEATYMIMEGAEQPYAMKLPAFVGGLRTRFDQEEKEWRDRDLFGLELEEIDFVSMEYPKQKNKSFILEKQNGDFTVRPFHALTPVSDKPMRKGMLEAYLVGFERLSGENFINDHSKRDSISRMVPFAIMTVKDNKGETQTVRFHPLRPNGQSGLPLTDEEVFTSTAVERYHVDHSKGDYILVQQRNVGRAFWAYDGFLEH
jgi:hypothetical protein